MTDQARGIFTQYLFVDESTYGVEPGSPSAGKVFLSSFGLDRSRPLETSKVLTGKRVANKTYEGNTDVKGSIETELNAEWIGYLLKHALGTVTSNAGGAVDEVTVSAAGSNYTSPPTVTFSGGGASTQATGTAKMGVSAIAVTAGGSGYTSAPTVHFSGGSSSTPATAHAVLTAGAVTSIVVDTPGYGYLTNPTVTLIGGGGSGATATSTIKLVDIVLATLGVGYVTAPSIGFSGGAGSGAAATASITTSSHKFEIADTLPTSFRLEMDTGLAGSHRYWRYGGLRVNAMDVTFPQSGPITCMWDLLGSNTVTASSSMDSTPDNFGHDTFVGFQATIRSGGTALANVKSCKLRLENNLATDGYVVGSASRVNAIEGEAKITIEMESLWDDDALVTLAENSTETYVTATVQRGNADGSLGNERIKFEIGPLKYELGAPRVTGPAGILVSHKATAYRSPSDTKNDRGGLKVWLRNSITGY
jgi:hypothetical protein